jgi:predicted porin
LHEFVATDCSLTWNGITLYGAYDVGVGRVSHGLPANGYNYEGESLVNRNGNLSQSGLGIRGKIEFMDDWYAVFNASTGINPQSGQLANMAATNTTNSALPRGSYSITGDGASAQGGYLLSGVEDDNLDSPKLVQVAWTGVKYAYDGKTDIPLSAYHQWQSDFRVPSACPPTSFRASCSGFLNEISLYTDHHFTKRFDVYAGMAYSNVSGGLAIAIPHGPGVPYNYNSNLAPTIGGRVTLVLALPSQVDVCRKPHGARLERAGGITEDEILEDLRYAIGNRKESRV